jgi:hypothetical protein
MVSVCGELQKRQKKKKIGGYIPIEETYTYTYVIMVMVVLIID